MKLLAVLVGATGVPACLDAATLAAAALPAAFVEALHMKVDPARLKTASEEIDIQMLRATSEGTAEERALHIHQAYLDWRDKAGDVSPLPGWRMVVGAEEDTVLREAGNADVISIVLSPENNLDSSDALHACVFDSGKPMFVVPHDWRKGGRRSFAHVMVALIDTEVTRHAIAGAGPWLRAAFRVTGLRVGKIEDVPASHAQLLSERGNECGLRCVERNELTLGAQIIAEARAAGADLLVAGAFRHPAALEWLLGGTTEELLRSADRTILFSH